MLLFEVISCSLEIRKRNEANSVLFQPVVKIFGDAYETVDSVILLRLLGVSRGLGIVVLLRALPFGVGAQPGLEL